MTEQVTYTCEMCGWDTTDRDHLHEINDKLYCDDCGITCDSCYEVIGTDYSWIEDLSVRWCTACNSDRASYCDYCETSYGDMAFYTPYDLSSDMCQECCERRFNWCGNCDNYYDDECACLGRVINEYSYKPAPVFNGTSASNLYFGIEIETEIWGDINEAAQPAENMDDHFYLKHDSTIGSGSNYGGFEIVSHPYSFEAWHDSDNQVLSYVDKIRDEHRARSWDAKSSCGIHIHISRAGFTSGAHTHRFISFIYSNPVQMSKLGGRKGSKYASFSDIYKYDDYGRPYKDIASKTKQGWSSDRYSAVNANNKDTLELRWFQGTLKRSGILAHIQLAHAIVEYTRYLTVAQVRDGALRWDRFTYYVADNMHIYPDLHAKILRLDSISISNTRPTINA